MDKKYREEELLGKFIFINSGTGIIGYFIKCFRIALNTHSFINIDNSACGVS